MDGAPRARGVGLQEVAARWPAPAPGASPLGRRGGCLPGAGRSPKSPRSPRSRRSARAASPGWHLLGTMPLPGRRGVGRLMSQPAGEGSERVAPQIFPRELGGGDGARGPGRRASVSRCRGVREEGQVRLSVRFFGGGLGESWCSQLLRPGAAAAGAPVVVTAAAEGTGRGDPGRHSRGSPLPGFKGGKEGSCRGQARSGFGFGAAVSSPRVGRARGSGNFAGRKQSTQGGTQREEPCDFLSRNSRVIESDLVCRGLVLFIFFFFFDFSLKSGEEKSGFLAKEDVQGLGAGLAQCEV